MQFRDPPPGELGECARRNNNARKTSADHALSSRQRALRIQKGLEERMRRRKSQHDLLAGKEEEQQQALITGTMPSSMKWREEDAAPHRGLMASSSLPRAGKASTALQLSKRNGISKFDHAKEESNFLLVERTGDCLETKSLLQLSGEQQRNR